jgi:methyl-accepting chemotaxis protein
LKIQARFTQFVGLNAPDAHFSLHKSSFLPIPSVRRAIPFSFSFTGFDSADSSPTGNEGTMQLLNRMRFSAKLGLMTGSAVLGLSTFAAIAYYTLRVVCIGSPTYLDIALAYQLAGDCYDPPASLVGALPPAIAAEDATTPEATRKYVELLRGTSTAFEASHKHYQEVLPAGAMRDLMRDESYPSGHQWFAISEQEYIPALLAGNHEAARKIRIEKMDVLFAQHKAANDKLAELTGSWIPREETNAARILASRSIELGVIFLCILCIVGFLGFSISRGIVQPVRKTLDVLTAMSKGDLSQSLDVGSSDEMGMVAEALNQTISSFHKVLSSILGAASQAAAASAELTATAQDTSNRSHDQAHEAEQVSSSMAEMVIAIQQVSRAAIDATQAGAATEQAANRGTQVVEETKLVLQRSAQVTAEASGQIESLGKSSDQIGQVINVIEEIASQTNLLALNAAIEAARAGEQGRGFAVVASEVRRLAERTTDATKTIAGMIASIQNDSARAVGMMEGRRKQVAALMQKVGECSDALAEIVRMVRDEETMVRQIANASEQQAHASSQVAESMKLISDFSAYATTAGEQTVRACSDLTKLASDLERNTQGFKLAN